MSNRLALAITALILVAGILMSAGLSASDGQTQPRFQISAGDDGGVWVLHVTIGKVRHCRRATSRITCSVWSAVPKDGDGVR